MGDTALRYTVGYSPASTLQAYTCRYRFLAVTDRELMTLTAALLATRQRRWSPETAAAEALRLWYFVGGELGPQRVLTETVGDHVRNALQILAATEGVTLDAEQLTAVRRRLELALAAAESRA